MSHNGLFIIPCVGMCKEPYKNRMGTVWNRICELWIGGVDLNSELTVTDRYGFSTVLYGDERKEKQC